MAASNDEASYGYSIDAPASPTTTFYALLGDNFYTYTTGPSDIDAYYLITSPGTNYSVVSLDNSTVGNTFISLYDTNGTFLQSSSDRGSFSGLTFTATTTKYIIGLSSSFSGVFGARVENNDVKEANGIGETINFGQTYSGAIDYVSDSDRFSFSVVAGAQYIVNISSAVSDLFVKGTYLYTISGNGYLPLTTVTSGANSYVYTAPETGIVEINLSSNSFVRTGPYSLSVTQTLANRAPSFSVSSQNLTTNEDTAASLSISASDPDNDSLSYSVISGASKGSVGLSGTTLTYTPSKDSNGNDSFVVRVIDGKGGAATQTINVTVNPVNDAPYFTNATASISTSVNTSISYSLTVFDVDNSTYTYTTSNPAHGTIQTAGSTITYTPSSGYVGSDSFSVAVNDGSGGTANQTIQIAVNGNRAPSFSSSSQSVSTNEDAAKTVTLSASDADNDPLTYSISTSALHGMHSVSGNTITYTPTPNYNGTDSFVVTASDGKGGTATQTVNVTVAAVNDAPTFSASSQSVAATAGTAKTITLAATDVDGDTLTYTVATPGKGTATISGSTLTYTPTASAAGSDSFVVTASDGKGGTATQTIAATIAASSTGASSAVDFRMSTSDGWTGTVGGNGQIFGSSGFQDIRVLSGTLTFDASFNRGGDIIRLPDAANSYSIVRTGSSAQISNSGLTTIIPVGTTGLASVFADGVRKLVFADGSLKIGSQAFSDSASITSGTDSSAIPTGADSAASARISLSGNSLAASQTAHITLGGTANVFGASSNDVVALATGAKSNLTFDASFNRGGDTVILGKDAGSFSALRSGSSIVLTSTDQTLTIPVGTAGLTLKFTDGDRSLAFAGGVFKIGDQTIEQTATALTSATVTISLDVGTDASRVTLSGSSGSVIFTDNAKVAGNVRISGFGKDDVIRVTGATASQYSFTSGDLDSDGSPDDLSIVFNAGSGVVNDIQILNVVSSSDFVFDSASAIKALGFNFITFG